MTVIPGSEGRREGERESRHRETQRERDRERHKERQRERHRERQREGEPQREGEKCNIDIDTFGKKTVSETGLPEMINIRHSQECYGNTTFSSCDDYQYEAAESVVAFHAEGSASF